MLDPAVIRHELHFSDRVLKCFADRPASVADKLAQVFAARAQACAIVDGYRRLTYAELDRRIHAAAGLLWSKGLRAGDRLVIVVPNRAEFVIAFLAAQRIGAIPVPVNIREAAPEIGFILDDCTASGLVYDPTYETAAQAARELAGAAWSLPIDAVWRGDPDVSFDQPACRDQDAAICILYTSGTTGKPKGALLSDLGVLHSMLHYELHLGVSSSDSSLLVVPATHITGLIGLVMATLGAGAKLVMVERFSTSDFVRTAAAEGMSFTIMVPAMYNLILLREDLSRHDLSRWRVGAYGGSVMPVETIAALSGLLPGLNLVNAYGATETTSPTSFVPLGTKDPAHFDTIGKPVACAEVLVMDENGCECPAGTHGELWIRGPMVIPGYWNRPEANALDFVGGFWRSGDIGEMTADGYLRIHDRKKDLVNRGGYKIFSAEVENVLLMHEHVVEAAVIGRPDPVLGERVHAFVSLDDSTVSERVLKQLCAQELADYKVPESFTLLATPLPRNANGKVLKGELRQMLTAGPEEDDRPQGGKRGGKA
ncbi:class I adenylate-forming enzyme family protein [Paracoccus solventivorans]|uniref:class I adenylate-forming enzyme family protein n=1 Tax=Paracoccus solventivorans TaxID=53463 RepID=UPI0026F07AB9|nr:class I adenylate-forming enzyme family protein [Paracoccus solventivorans]